MSWPSLGQNMDTLLYDVYVSTFKLNTLKRHISRSLRSFLNILDRLIQFYSMAVVLLPPQLVRCDHVAGPIKEA